jgi:uncharacterized membrane protein
VFGYRKPQPHPHRLDPKTAALHRKLDHLIRAMAHMQETSMSQYDDLKAILDALHQTIADNIAEQNVKLQAIADANAANDPEKIASLIRQATQDNADLIAENTKSKGAAAVVAAAPPAAPAAVDPAA